MLQAFKGTHPSCLLVPLLVYGIQEPPHSKGTFSGHFKGLSQTILVHATEELVYREPLRVLKGPSHLLYVSHNT